MVFPQLAKRAVRPVGGGREHVADLDLVVGDDHAVDEQFGQLPPLGEGGGGQDGPDGPAECLDAVGDCAEFEPLPGRGVQLALLGESLSVSGIPGPPRSASLKASKFRPKYLPSLPTASSQRRQKSSKLVMRAPSST
jgi:hypothetical protein